MTSRSPRKRNSSASFQPIDRWVGMITLVMVLAIAGVLLMGDRTAPSVLSFSWQDQLVTANDRAFLITFSRPMDKASVEKNLTINPPLAGKFSWAGRRMAFTLSSPLIYGQSYQIKLTNAFDRFAQELSPKRTIAPFTGQFRTPIPQLAFVDRQGRLQLYDLRTAQSQQIGATNLPSNLQVTDYRIPHDRQGVIFLGIVPPQSLLEQQLYRLNLQNKTASLVVDDPDYQNFKFDLSPDGQTIVLQRLHRIRKGEYGLWVIKGNAPPRPLDNQPGGEFQIAPDNASLAIAQGEGIAILALEPDIPPLDFLPRFGSVLSFAPSGRRVAMIAFNKDFTRSLYIVSNTGEQKELLRLKGSILSAQFAPQEQKLYCLLSQLQESTQEYREDPYLVEIDLNIKQVTTLLDLKGQGNLMMHLAPDGQYLALSSGEQNPQTNAAANNQLNIIDLKNQKVIATLQGSRPRWLP